jgi:hypothetical protein
MTSPSITHTAQGRRILSTGATCRLRFSVGWIGCAVVSVVIPESVKEKVLAFGESSYGAYRVQLVLADGRMIPDVVLAWGDEIVRVGSADVHGPDDLDFEVTDVADALPSAV